MWLCPNGLNGQPGPSADEPHQQQVFALFAWKWRLCTLNGQEGPYATEPQAIHFVIEAINISP